ncbi:MAG: polysaccharide biosynthesis C-terminal domain-containing protein [Bacteroidales bacterium]|nr:polysaccharide biosynthesis C-terminal domain-containing protein [Bacteroidales bacterium]
MQRKFLTNLIFLILLNLLIKPFWIFGIDRTVQNVVGSQDFGFYFTLLNFSFIFNILLDLGITNFNNRNIAQHTVLLKKHFSGILTLKLLLSVVYFVVTFSIAFLIGYRGHQLNLLALVGFNQFLISLIMYMRSNISGMLMFRTESLMSVFDRVLMIGIMSILLWGNVSSQPFKIEWFVYAQTAAYGFTAFVGFIIVVLKSGFRRLSWNPVFFLMILKKSAPFALLVLLMTLYHRIDSVLLERLLPDGDGETQVGIYAHAFRIMDAANQLAYLFAILLMPIFSKMIKEKQALIQMIKMPMTLLFTATFILAIGSWMYSYELMELLYLDNIQESASVLSILIFGSIAVAISYVFGTLLTANGDLKILIGIASFSMFVSFSLNALLIPHYAALGSAIANVSALFSSMILHLIFAYKQLNISFKPQFYLRLITFSLSVLGIAYVTFELGFEWWKNLGVFVLLSLIIAFFLRLLNIREIYFILSKREKELVVEE